MTAIMIELNEEQTDLLARVCKLTGTDVAVVVQDALAVYESTLDNDYRRHFTPEEIAAIEEGIDDAKHGRTVSNAEVFSELRAEYGW